MEVLEALHDSSMMTSSDASDYSSLEIPTTVSLLDLAQAPTAPTTAPPLKKYWDKANYATYEDQEEALRRSCTAYVGNMSFYTGESLVYEFLRQAGPIKRVVMGLHRVEKTPCGFCFAEYFTREHCLDAERLLSGKMLDGRIVKVEIDPGFKEGRQYGRGKAGGQVRDDFRDEFDSDRGGFGSFVQAGILPVAGAPPVAMMPAFVPPAADFAPRPPPPMHVYKREEYREEHRPSRRHSPTRRDSRERRRPRSRERRRASPSPPRHRRRDPSPPPAAPGTILSRVDEFGRDIAPAAPARRDDDDDDDL